MHERKQYTIKGLRPTNIETLFIKIYIHYNISNELFSVTCSYWNCNSHIKSLWDGNTKLQKDFKLKRTFKHYT